MAKKSWYLAPSLVTLFAEINRRWPQRSRVSDGTIGDAAHRASKSEHNPNKRGSVNAIDVTGSGIDGEWLVAHLIKDARVWYVIYKGVICSRTYGFRPRKYTGRNGHYQHVHVSIRTTTRAENNTASWGIGSGLPVAPPARPSASAGAGSSTTRPGRPFALGNVIAARRTSPARYDGNVTTVQTYLNRHYTEHGQGRLEVDGYWSTITDRVYAGWQRSRGYTGKDADGEPGRASLQALLGNDYHVV